MARRPKDTTPRRCLKCGGLFDSLWVGNRICPTCAGQNAKIVEHKAVQATPTRATRLGSQ